MHCKRQLLPPVAALLAATLLVAPASHAFASPLVQSARTKSSAKRPTTTTKRTAARRPARPTPLVGTTPVGVQSLAADLKTMLSARVRNGTWGAVVTSLSRGETLFSHNPDSPFLPASTLKLFTTTLAFERLGVHYTFSTDVLRDGTIAADGTLGGSLILRGGGDPSLSGRFFGHEPEAPMRALAEMVATAGIKRVSGDLVADASAFEKRVIPDGWLARYLQDSYAARVSALSLNGNLLHVAIAPGKSKKTTVSLRPAVDGFKIINQSVVRGTSRGGRLSVSQRAGNTIVVSGWIGSRSGPRVYSVVVEDPALFAASAFRAALEKQGISVEGKIRFSPTPATATNVGSLTSPPLYQLAAVMNGQSDNHFAELLLRNASRGSEHGIVGSAELANEQLRALLAERAGVSPDALSIADGSGLSSKDRITPRAMTSLLSYANTAPWAREFHASLPVAGRTETLRHRMSNTPAQGNLHAKTGTTNDAIALSGFVTAASGELLAFSFLYNGRESGPARETIDAMGATLAAFSR